MLIKSSPGSIHTAHNPVLFAFEGTINEIQQLVSNRGQIAIALPRNDSPLIVAELSIYFHNSIARIDISPVLRSLFTRPVDTLNNSTPCLIDNAQSLYYLVLYKNNVGDPAYTNGYNTAFTALRPAVQLTQTHDMQWAHNRFLTPFISQYKYEAFPFDISAFSDGNNHINNIPLTDGRINRVLVQTDSNIILKFND